MSFLTAALFAGLSLAVGLLMGVLGGGGGGFYLVILIAVLKLPPATAVGSSLALSAITLAGAGVQYWRENLVRRDYLYILAVFGTVSVIAASLFLNKIPESVLTPGIIVVFLLSGASSLIRVRRGGMEDSHPKPAGERFLPLACVGTVSGLLSGLFGLSGTTPLTSLLIGAFDVDAREAVGTTTVVTLCISLAGGLFHLGSKALDIKTVVVFGLGSLIGSIIGARLARKIDRRLITIVIAVMAVGSGVFLAFRHG